MHTSHRVIRLVLAILLVGVFLEAAPLAPVRKIPTPPAPPPPEQHDIVVRYRIEGARNDRLARYFRLIEDLRLAGFTRDEKDVPSEIEPQDPKHTLLSGSIARSGVSRVLAQPDVQAVLLAPKGKMPQGKDEPVRVEMRLAGGLPTAQQRDLHAQASLALNAGGFGEAIGYDNRQYTRIVGQVPVGKVALLLEDLRRQPNAWAVLPKSFMGDVRKDRAALMPGVFDEWQKNPEGKKLLLSAVLQWQTYPAAIDFGRALPALVTQEPLLLQETQIRHFAGHADAAELLGKLLDEVRKSEAGPELMDVLLSRAEASGATASMPLLYRTSPPVRIIEARPDLPLPAVPASVPEIPKGQEKFSTDLRALVADVEEAKKPRRFEMLLRDPVPEKEPAWADRFDSLSVGIEGRLGSVVTVFGPPSEAAKIAEIADVVAVRLPRRGDAARHPDRELKAECGEGPRRVPSLIRQYADAGRLRQVVLIGADFRGWEDHKGEGLPGRTRLLDLTRERNRDVEPDPVPGDPKEIGAGTRAALALANLAGTSDLLLVRVDPETPYMVDHVARLTSGDLENSLGLVARLRDLGDDRRELDGRGERLTEERNRILTDFRPEAQKLREEHDKKQAAYNKDRLAFEGRQTRYLAHEKLTFEIRKMRVVWNTLTWDEGYPVFDTGALSRKLDDRPYPGLWLQSRGGDARRIWHAMLRDEDHSGFLDLLPAGELLPEGRWNPDLGFLAWKNEKDERVVDLPAGVVLRLGVQWKEVHDPDLARTGGDHYLEPLARLELQVFHQPDPQGKAQPADDLALMAQSSGMPQRLLNVPRFGVYEQAVEFKVEKAGRYLVRVSGIAPEHTRPRNMPTIPAAMETAELHPRLVIRTLTGAGEALFEDPPPVRASLPMPADALRAVPLGER